MVNRVKKNGGFIMFWAILLVSLVPVIAFLVLRVSDVGLKATEFSRAATTLERMQHLATRILSTAKDVDDDGLLELVKEDVGNKYPSTLPPFTALDSWNKEILYCTWDVGDENLLDPSYTNNNVSAPRDDVIATFISGGPSGVIETACGDIVPVGDDRLLDILHSEAMSLVANKGGWKDLGDNVVLSTEDDSVAAGSVSAEQKLDIGGALNLKSSAPIPLHGVMQWSDGDNKLSTYINNYNYIRLNGKTPEHRKENTSLFVVSSATSLGVDAISKLVLCVGGDVDYDVNLPTTSGLSPGDSLTIVMGHDDETKPTNETMLGLVSITSPDSNIDGKSKRVMWAGESAVLEWTGSKWTKVSGHTRQLHLEREVGSLPTQNYCDYHAQPFTATPSQGPLVFRELVDFTANTVKFPRDSVYKITYGNKFPSAHLNGTGMAFAWRVLNINPWQQLTAGGSDRYGNPGHTSDSESFKLTTNSEIRVEYTYGLNRGSFSCSGSYGPFSRAILSIVEQNRW